MMRGSGHKLRADGSEAFLDALAADLRAVRPLDDRAAWAVLAVLMLATIGLVAGGLGLRADLGDGQPHPMLLLRAGILLALGCVAARALLAHAHPGVGRSQQGWRVAVLIAGLFPAAAVAVLLQSPAAAVMQRASSGIECLTVSLAAAAGLALPLVVHLRRGAPVAPERAGLLVGLAAGSLGAFAYSLHCPYDDVVYIGVWNGLAVALASLAGRLLLPPLIRW